MKVRRVPAAETSGEGLVALVIAGSLLIGAAWLWLRLPTPVCVFHLATGVPCPTCGGTRCARALLAGDLAGAVAWNPLVFLTGIAVIVAFVYASAVALLRLPRWRIGEVPAGEQRWIRILVVAAFLANWAYVIFVRRL